MILLICILWWITGVVCSLRFIKTDFGYVNTIDIFFALTFGSVPGPIWILWKTLSEIINRKRT